MIELRAKIAWPITWSMLQLFALGYKLKKWPVVFYPYAFVFIILDVLYNWTVGAFIFWERPHEILFTSTLSKHKLGKGRNQTEESKALAFYYCSRLNEHDPGHC